MLIGQVAMSFFIALLLSGVSMPFIILICHRRRWYDAQDHRKLHEGDIPRLGGIGICLGWIGGALLIPALFNYGDGGLDSANAYRLAVLVFCASAIHLTGLWDDFSNLRPRRKIIVQIGVAVITALGGIRFYTLAIPFTEAVLEFAPLSFLFSVFWIVGVINAVNLIDGLDGLSSIVSFIAAVAMGLLAVSFGKPITAILCFALAGGILGFFLFNKPPAKIFMGDSGSLFLGYLLGVLPLLEIAETRPLTWGLSVTILLIPVTDTLFAISRRIRRRQSIASPDREHIHHLLLGLGLPDWAVLATVGSYALILAIFSLVLIRDRSRNFSITILLLWLGTFALIHFIHKLWGKNNSSSD